jgi:DNA-binding MarR family transcriptional regulator
MAAHAMLIKHLAATDVWDGLSMREYDVLYTLSKCPAPIAQSELERHVLLSQPAISRLVDRLVTRGLVCRAADRTDGRRVLLSLTESGRDIQHRIGSRHARDVTRAVTARLTRGEIAELRRLARKLAEPPADPPAGTVSDAGGRRGRRDGVAGPPSGARSGQSGTVSPANMPGPVTHGEEKRMP